MKVAVHSLTAPHPTRAVVVRPFPLSLTPNNFTPSRPSSKGPSAHLELLSHWEPFVRPLSGQQPSSNRPSPVDLSPPPSLLPSSLPKTTTPSSARPSAVARPYWTARSLSSRQPLSLAFPGTAQPLASTRSPDGHGPSHPSQQTAPNQLVTLLVVRPHLASLLLDISES